MPSIIIGIFSYLIKSSYLCEIHTIIACVLIEEEIDTEVKLLIQSLTANYRSQTLVIGLFKAINMYITAVLLLLLKENLLAIVIA